MEYHVPSVALAMRILNLLSRYKYRNCSLKDLADKLNVNKTTCLRVLRTLEKEDFVQYDEETKKYSLGPYLIPLGNRAAELIDSVAASMTEMKAVAASTGLTTVLVQRLRSDRLIYIASAEPPGGDVRITVSVGQELPVTGAAFGKCFLAYDDVSERQRLAAHLQAYTPNTIVDAEQFLASLAEVRRSGYAVSHAELIPGISALAVPIFGRSGQVNHVLACLAVTTQLKQEEQPAILDILRATAHKLSEWNGFQNQRFV